MHIGDGAPLTPRELWTAWPFEPLVALTILLSGWLYARGMRARWEHAGKGRGLPAWRVWAFTGGLVASTVALLSPLASAGEALFSAHMAQHVVLMLVGAPLLVLGSPLHVMLWAFPQHRRRTLGRMARASWIRRPWHALTHPLTCWVLHAAAIWLWHIPALFQLTLVSEAAHVAQHVSFFGSALLFWFALGEHGYGRRMPAGAGILYVFTTAVHSAALGALLTFSEVPLYPAYGNAAPAWGLTPLEDQQLAGLIMWIPAGMIYVIAGLLLFTAMLRAAERASLTAGGRL